MSGLDDTRCNYCKEHGFRHPNLCEDCRASATPADVGEEPAAWRVRPDPGFAWVYLAGDPERNPAIRDYERQPVYPATALERVVRERDTLRARLETVEAETPDYDAGLLNDYGGGDVGWWQDYLRAEIGRANDYWREAIRNLEPRHARHD